MQKNDHEEHEERNSDEERVELLGCASNWGFPATGAGLLLTVDC